jgi:hypothetical protein
MDLFVPLHTYHIRLVSLVSSCANIAGMVKSGLSIIFLIGCKELLITRVTLTTPLLGKEVIAHTFKRSILLGYKGGKGIRDFITIQRTPAFAQYGYGILYK